MNDSEPIRDEIITILVLIMTLAFSSSNLTPESSEDKSLDGRLLLTEAIY